MYRVGLHVNTIFKCKYISLKMVVFQEQLMTIDNRIFETISVIDSIKQGFLCIIFCGLIYNISQ